MTPIESLRQRPLIATAPFNECAVCGNGQWRSVANGYDYEYETCGNEWVYQSCGECGHIQITELPAPDTLSTIYPSTYYSYTMEKSVHPIARWAKSLLDKRKFKNILAAPSIPIDCYLDVGCGDGRYLQHMIDAGVDRTKAFGVELDERAVAAAISKGYAVRQCRIEDASHLPLGGIDLVTMFHVIEHVARPDHVVGRLHDLLKVGGTLAIETPNFDCLDVRLSGKGLWGGYHIPRHWHIFTPASLTKLLRNAGFSIIDLRYQTGHAFWLWTLHHWLKYRKGLPRLANFCHPLRNIPLLAIATAFDILRIGLGFRTSAMLVVARKDQ